VKSQFGAHVGVGAWFNSGVEHGSVPDDGCDLFADYPLMLPMMLPMITVALEFCLSEERPQSSTRPRMSDLPAKLESSVKARRSGRDDTGGEMHAENAPANETAKEASAKKAAATK
jgi:hypothetical protein